MTFKEIENKKKNRNFLFQGRNIYCRLQRVIILSEISLSVRRIEWSRAWISKAICLQTSSYCRTPCDSLTLTRECAHHQVAAYQQFFNTKKKYLVFLFFFKKYFAIEGADEGGMISNFNGHSREREREILIIFLYSWSHSHTRYKRRDNIFILFLLKFIFFLISSQNCFFFVCAVYNLCPLIAVSQCIERLFSLFIGLLILPMTRRSRWRRRK